MPYLQHYHLKDNVEEQYICTKPFEWIDISSDKVDMCCPTWINKPLGNILSDSLEDIWNGIDAQEIRQSMHDGSFRYCNDLCPFKNTRTGPVQSKEKVLNNPREDERIKNAIAKELTILPYGPLAINAAYDRSCNLSCPSCRVKNIMASGKEKEKALRLQDAMLNECMDDCYHLYITGSGDPFGSPTFFKLLKEFNPDEFPELNFFTLHTNGQLWTPESWDKISNIHHLVRAAHISIDACSPETYAINRRGGDWDKLMENLDFIRDIKNKQGFSVTISFVVQQNNWREMKDFIELGSWCDLVFFGKLADWGTWSEEELHSRQVYRTDHPEHREFVDFISDPVFNTPKVWSRSLLEL
jgi:MoaA/NifB/PqqE/SkfB family radical SAM enzyme